jgi:histidinol phosphatase-like PHP family hydrolase
MSLSRKTDLHVFHFRAPQPLGGDLDAVFTPRQIVDWVERFGVFDRFVLGNHPPTFFRIRTKLPPGEYLDAMSSSFVRLRERFSGKLFSGLECDFFLPKRGKIGFRPGERLLSRYNPDVSLIAFHFHHTLTYAKRYDIAIADLVGALRWAIRSGMFSILAHPFDVLGRIYREDRRGFEVIADLAREKKVAVEINADKGFDGEAISSLVKNGNLFSFGGDFHALSYWLKRDAQGIEAGGDRKLIERVVGLTREAIDKEKRYWGELDPIFWNLPCSGEERWALRDRVVYHYRRGDKKFEGVLNKITSYLDGREKHLVVSRLRDLHQIYAKWGGAPTKGERKRAERYFLHVPLTDGELQIYERWLARAFKLGLKEENLINNWDTPKLEAFFHRRL